MGRFELANAKSILYMEGRRRNGNRGCMRTTKSKKKFYFTANGFPFSLQDQHATTCSRKTYITTTRRGVTNKQSERRTARAKDDGRCKITFRLDSPRECVPTASQSGASFRGCSRHHQCTVSLPPSPPRSLVPPSRDPRRRSSYPGLRNRGSIGPLGERHRPF